MSIYNEDQTCGAKTNTSLKAELIPTPMDVGSEVCSLNYVTPSFDT